MLGDIEDGQGMTEDYASMAVGARDNRRKDEQGERQTGSRSGRQDDREIIGVHRSHGGECRGLAAATVSTQTIGVYRQAPRYAGQMTTRADGECRRRERACPERSFVARVALPDLDSTLHTRSSLSPPPCEYVWLRRRAHIFHPLKPPS